MNLFLKKKEIFPHDFIVEWNQGRAIEREGGFSKKND